MPKNARDVKSALARKGFRLKENDHTYFHLFVEGRKTAVYTKISHGEKQIGDKLLSRMARQVRLSRREFVDFIDCALFESRYIALVRARGAIS